MNFGEALDYVRGGATRIARDGWNGKGMWLFAVERWTIHETFFNDYPRLPFLAMKTATGEVIPWVASQADLLATDWIMVL